MCRSLLLVLFLIIGNSIISFGQKRSLEIDDFADWNRIGMSRLSNNGEWLMYQIKPNHGDAMLVLKSVEGSVLHRFERGEKGVFFPNNNSIAFIEKAPLDSIRTKLVDGDKAPKSSIKVYSILKDSLLTVNEVSSFKISKEKQSWLAFTSEVELETKKDSVQSKDANVDKDDTNKSKGKETKTNLYIVNGVSLDTMIVRKVTNFVLSERGHTLAYVQHKDDSLKHASLFYLNLNDGSVKKVLSSDNASFEKLTLDKEGFQLAYMFSSDTTKIKHFVCNFYEGRKDANKTISYLNDSKLHEGMEPSINRSIEFSEDGGRLYFGVQYPKTKAPKDSLMKNEKARLDLWSWNDKDIQPRQLVNLSKDKKRSFVALYQIKKDHVIAMNDSSCLSFDIPNKGLGDYAIGIDNLPYRLSYSWSALWGGDYYAFDLKSGKKELIAKNIQDVDLSPDGRFAIYYQWSDSTYYAKDLKRDNTFALTDELTTSFYDVSHDTPSSPSPYGVMGFGSDRTVYVYDEFDVWKIDLTQKKAPHRITSGRSENLKYRYIRLDKEEDYVSERPLFYVTNKETMSTAYAYLDRSTNALKEYMKGDYMLSYPVKAKSADVLKWSKQTYRIYPDYFTSNLEFNNSTKQTDINPQQKDFKWGNIKMVKWVSFNGDSLKGLLVTPENMDKGKKYPMMCYFYERYSDRLHQYWLPSPSRSTINKSLYPSNDYVLFIPDVYYREGYPGQSAYDAIVSGAYAMCERYDFIDRFKMALQGQSWGGYQTAYLITQTNMFAAAMAGAPVSNMTSAYGGIRWGSGLSREFQYEQTQSRIGGTLWDKPMQYIENSPVFYAPKVRTPLLIMHNDEDGAVPWYQGIEYFMALRRLQKPVWMLQYNGQPHNLSADAWGDRIDLSRRMLQFFNHYLKGEPAPKWMNEGVKAINKGEDLGY
ncbi:prolyl oligopeptidase family serine peptidase [Halosquirtibacter xylanolyticus]|uniref:alpha/beta hydrolase family protein n=1 Tax=Halosquirtibacter xylanolyticus TaxID=3374599 RepID=UPI003749A14E|nr:prolyl oligopeptidase family serine peptidase [Prolixibacteraceae bacterium]